MHKREDVRRALEHAREHDPDRLVRKVAGWAAPGGPIFRRLTPRPARKTREQVQRPWLPRRRSRRRFGAPSTQAAIRLA